MDSIIQRNPANGAELGKFKCSDLSKFGEMMKSCRNAQKLWSSKTFSERGKCLLKMKNSLYNRREQFAKILSECTGKTLVTSMSAVLAQLQGLDWYVSNAEKILSQKKISGGSILFANKKSYEEYSPVGIIGIISPFNYPFNIPFSEIMMALISGNGVMFKCARDTVMIGEIITEIVNAGGFPEGLFHHVIGKGRSVADLMFQHKVDKIFFTGSVGVGKALMKGASANLTPLSLELGGNDAMIVLESADIERATNGAIWAGLSNCGQSCAGVERIYVQKKIYKTFVEVLSKKVNAMRHGDPTGPEKVDMGPMTTPDQRKVVVEQLEDAIQKGAKIAAQSKPVGDVSKGLFHPATVLVNVDHSMITMSEETFGPLLPVMPFDNIQDAIRWANDSQYALTASIWGKNKVARPLASQLDAGTITINDHLYTHGSPNLAWGGWKLSGLGRTHGEEGLKEMCNLRIVNLDILPSYANRRNLWWMGMGENTYWMLNILTAFVCARWKIVKWWYLLRIVPSFLKKMMTYWKPWDENKKEKKEKKKE